MVLNKGISGVGQCISGESSDTVVHVDTQRCVEVLLDSCLDINHISKKVLVARSLKLPVICAVDDDVMFSITGQLVMSGKV